MTGFRLPPTGIPSAPRPPGAPTPSDTLTILAQKSLGTPLNDQSDGRYVGGAFELAPEAQERLRTWWQTTHCGERIAGKTTRELLYELIRDAAKPGYAGEVHRSAARDIGLVPDFVARVMPFLEKFAAEHHVDLGRFRMHYIGHATQPIVSLFQMLAVLGLGRGQVSAANYSGQESAHDALDITLAAMLRARGIDDDHDYDANESLERVSSCPAREELLRQASLAETNGETLLVDKGGILFEHGPLDPALAAMVREGRIRFLQHNSDDIQALAQSGDSAWITEVNGSLPKLLEAREIGEATALSAAREVRRKWFEPIGGSHVFVLGYGVIGRGLVLALRRLGLPADRIVVVEPDPKRRAQASHVCEAWPELHPTAFASNVVFNATPAPALNGHNITMLGRRVMVFNMASAGKGVDFASIEARGQEDTEHRSDRITQLHRYGPQFQDRVYAIPRVGVGPCEVTLINVGAPTSAGPPKLFPVNLFEAPWPDRFAATTAMAVVSGVFAAAAQTQPGRQPTVRAIDRHAIRLFHACGLRQLRPLDYLPGGAACQENPYWAKKDMESFKIQSFTVSDWTAMSR